jgi:uncharacterized cofD-like protein
MSDPSLEWTLPAEGPSVVAIGGGHGLARSLGAIRRYASEVTAVVSVADDGGSSGRLRAMLSIPAPGDIRRCLLALTPRPSLLADALEYRFDAGELEGHALGNLLLAALTATTGDFLGAVHTVGEMLGAIGTVLPATTVPVELAGECADGRVVGQVRIMASSRVTAIELVPSDVQAPSQVVEAIERADQIVIGPGSLYTSVLAALAPEGIVEALHASRARRVYVCNLREQIPETASYSIADHVSALIAHEIVPDVVVADARAISLGDVPRGVDVVETRLTSRQPLVHDEVLLAETLRSQL